MVDVAFELMLKKKNAVTFVKIWDEVSQIKGLTPQQAEDNIAQFYTDISLDGRFVHMGNNKWDLKTRHRFDEVVIDNSDLIDDEEEIDEYDVDEDEKVIEDDYS